MTSLVLLLLVASVRVVQTRDVAAEAPRIPPAVPVGQQEAAAPASSSAQAGTQMVAQATGALVDAVYAGGLNTSATSQTTLQASTIAYNKADRLPTQHIITVGSGPVFTPATRSVNSGDYVQFQSSNQGFTLLVQGAGCNVSQLAVPPLGAGLSQDLVCTTTGSDATGTVTVSGFSQPVFQMTVTPPTYTAQAHSLYVGEFSSVAVGRSLVVHGQGLQSNCRLGGATADITSNGYNVVGDTTCNLTLASDICGAAALPVEDWLGPLQDNNQIDFESRQILLSIAGGLLSHRSARD